jgi:Tfp pilus assembly protein PilV
MLFAPKEQGQGMIEYLIAIVLIIIVIAAIMRLCKYNPK